MQLRLVAPLVVVLASSAAAQTAPSAGCTPPAAVLRQRALELVKADRDPDAVIRGLDEFMGLDTALMTLNPVNTVHYSEEIFIALFSPYTSYRTAVAEALRKREDVATVQVQRDIRIVVSPSRIDAPDIVRVIVERDGKPVPATMNTLKPTTMTTRMGAKGVLHSGTINFNCQAFTPGAIVSVIAIPESGANLERTFSSRELKLITGQKYTAQMATFSGDLVGIAGADVQVVFGQPREVAGSRWTYGTGSSSFYLYLSDAGIVTKAFLENLPLRDFKVTR